MSLLKLLFGTVTVFGLVACASADGQSGPSAGQTEGQPVNAAVQAGNATPESYVAQCNARCYSNYYSALDGCYGDATCICFAEQAEGACLAQCQGRTFIRHAC